MLISSKKTSAFLDTIKSLLWTLGTINSSKSDSLVTNAKIISLDGVSKFSVSELSTYLDNELQGKVDNPDHIASIFEENKITGLMFLTLTPEELQELVPIIGERKTVKNVIDSLKEPTTSVTTVRIIKFGLEHLYSLIGF